MVKGARVTGESSNENPNAEIGDLREMMQNLITAVGHLAGKVSSLEKLDHTVMELRKQLAGDNRRNTVPLRNEGDSDQGERVELHREREWSLGNCNNSQFHNCPKFHHSSFNRWSRMEFLKFNGDDLRSWLFKIEQFFSMENVAA
ncbi:hypothetical protein T459_22818 [Capsicum annuum]|uniref:Uncharacterized protein n=1 Tax=Capsicum annuum TaxID=4072 RepID=A0A2G2YQM2_CAPAN|nr:hypothetical protein T459_22818 [Capsicum annuum]